MTSYDYLFFVASLFLAASVASAQDDGQDGLAEAAGMIREARLRGRTALEKNAADADRIRENLARSPERRAAAAPDPEARARARRRLEDMIDATQSRLDTAMEGVEESLEATTGPARVSDEPRSGRATLGALKLGILINHVRREGRDGMAQKETGGSPSATPRLEFALDSPPPALIASNGTGDGIAVASKLVGLVEGAERRLAPAEQAGGRGPAVLGGGNPVRSDDELVNRVHDLVAAWNARNSEPARRDVNAWIRAAGDVGLDETLRRLEAERMTYRRFSSACEAQGMVVSALNVSDHVDVKKAGQYLVSTKLLDLEARSQTLAEISRCRAISDNALRTLDEAIRAVDESRAVRDRILHEAGPPRP